MERSFSHLVELEAALDACLVDHRTQARFSPGWMDAGRRWSEAVWSLAGNRKPAPPGSTPEPIPGFAQRPVFICGAHRSGTTLLRDLLDGHPALCVLPAEARYFGDLEARVKALGGEERLAAIGQEWLHRLVNPINQPPFWLLGRSTTTASAYVDFAASYAGWASRLRDASVPAADLAGVACAFARARGQNFDQLAWWIEKTPGTERHLARIRRMFPHARIIQVVRDPDEAARSYKALLQRANRDAGSMLAMLRELIRSCRICSRELRAAAPERYFALPYDALVADRAEAMRRVAAFLGIEDHPALGVQSIAGLPASPNSSYRGPAPASTTWSLPERLHLAVARLCYRRVRHLLR